MQNRITSTIIFLLGFLMLNAQTKEYDYTVYFESGKHELNEKQYKQFKVWMDIFHNKELAQIRITGHTDSQGSAETNLILSEKRAATIADYFNYIGASKDIISMTYQGENQLLSMDMNDDSKAQNRRVEIFIQLKPDKIIGLDNKTDSDEIPKKEAIIVEKEQKPDAKDKIKKFYEQLDSHVQQFTINANEISEIRGEKGTIVMLGEKVLCDCETQKNVEGEVEVGLREYISVADFLQGNLSTKSDRRMLSSSGTIHISAKQNGKELCIQNGKSYEVLFPINPNTQSLEMTSFEGEWDADGNMNWKKQDGSDNLLNYDALAANWGRNKYGASSGRQVSRYSGWKRFCLFFQRFPRSLYSRAQLSKKKEAEVLAMRKEMQEKQKAIRKGNITREELDMATVNYYVLKMNDLGWRNCDMFADIPKQQLAYMNVNLKPDNNTSLKLVFPKWNAIMQGSPIRGKKRYGFGGLPRGETAKLVAIRLRGDLPEIAMMDVKVGTSVNMEKFTFQSYSIDEMREILSSIN